MKTGTPGEGTQKTAGKHPWLEGRAPTGGGIGRAEMRSILGDLKALFETIEVGDADALRTVREKGAEGLKVVNELDQIFATAHQKLTALRGTLDQIIAVADDEEPSPADTTPAGS